jgi:hypothetical protein
MTSVLLGIFVACAALGADKPTGEFSATASIDTPSGTRSMAFDVVVSNPRSLADVVPLKKVLENGGQQALANAIRGGGQGQIKLGALVYPVDLVAAERIEDGWRYFIVTTRPINTGSEEDGGASLDYPFAVFGFDRPGRPPARRPVWRPAGNADGRFAGRPVITRPESRRFPR